MKKSLIILMILFLLFATLNANTNQNFNPILIDDRICFTLEEGNELLEIVKLHPINLALIEKYKAKEKVERKKRIINVFISGGIGILIGGFGVGVLVVKLN